MCLPNSTRSAALFLPLRMTATYLPTAPLTSHTFNEFFLFSQRASGFLFRLLQRSVRRWIAPEIWRRTLLRPPPGNHLKILLEFFCDRRKILPCRLNERKNMTKPIPDGFHTVTPHIVVSDAAKAIEFYKKALGAQEDERIMAPDGKAVM